MATITVRVTEDGKKNFWMKWLSLKEKSLSELLKTKTLRCFRRGV